MVFLGLVGLNCEFLRRESRWKEEADADSSLSFCSTGYHEQKYRSNPSTVSTSSSELEKKETPAAATETAKEGRKVVQGELVPSFPSSSDVSF